MNVLIVFDYPHYHGGVNRILNLAKGLKGSCTVYLLGVAFDNELPFWKYRVTEEVVEGVRVMRFHANHLLPFLLFQFIFLRKFLKANPVDIVQAYNPTYLTCLSPVVLKAMGKIKLVIMYDDIVTLRDEFGFFHLKVLQLIEKIACKLADKVAILTSFQKEYLLRRGIPNTKLSLIPNFVDADSIFSSLKGGKKVRRQLGIEGKVILGYVGSVNRRSGLEDVIKVMPSLRAESIHLLVVGDGDALEELKGLARNTGASDMVTFVGRVPHAEVGRYYSAMDVLICPLKDSPANLAVDHLKLYEYLATGKPTIASRVGSVLSIVEDGVNGILYTPGNLDELSDKILFLASDHKKALDIGLIGRESVKKKHALAEISKHWHELYLEAMSRVPLSALEREYTSLYLPVEVEGALDLIGLYMNSGKNALLCTNDEVLLFKLLSRSFKETYVLTDKEEFFQDIEKAFQFNAVPWSTTMSKKFDIAVVAFEEPRLDSPKDLDVVLNSTKALLVLFPLFIRYNLAENQYKIPILYFLRDLAFPFLLRREMRNRGFQVEKIIGFRTLKSFFLGRFIWFLKLAGNEKRADQLYFKNFKQSLSTDSWLKYLSALVLLVGRKHG